MYWRAWRANDALAGTCRAGHPRRAGRRPGGRLRAGLTLVRRDVPSASAGLTQTTAPPRGPRSSPGLAYAHSHAFHRALRSTVQHRLRHLWPLARDDGAPRAASRLTGVVGSTEHRPLLCTPRQCSRNQRPSASSTICTTPRWSCNHYSERHGRGTDRGRRRCGDLHHPCYTPRTSLPQWWTGAGAPPHAASAALLRRHRAGLADAGVAVEGQRPGTDRGGHPLGARGACR